MDILVEAPRSGQVAGMLHEREIPFSVAIGDVGLMMEKELGGSLSKNNSRNSADNRSSEMDWKKYHRLHTIYSFMDNLVAEYPYLCSVRVIGRSCEGRDIKMLRISNGNSENTSVWLDGSIHSREWISVAVVTFIADRIVRTFHEQPESVTNKDWYILPVMNPDGYEYTHTHDRMWRKNRARYGECIGVDLNRNFSLRGESDCPQLVASLCKLFVPNNYMRARLHELFALPSTRTVARRHSPLMEELAQLNRLLNTEPGYGWGEKGEEGSSEDAGNVFYRGPKPFSEPETVAVKKVILESENTFKVFLSFHSYGEVIIFPWGYTGDPCPDYVEMLEGGTAMAKAIHETSGHTYKVGSTKDLMYFAAGTSTDWSYAVANIPYSYMVELRGKKHRFLLPKEEILSTATEVFNGVLRLMDFVDRRCKGTGTCPCPK